MFNLEKNITDDGPRVVEIQLRTHGDRKGRISFEKNTIHGDGNMFYATGMFIKNLLENGVEKVYIKTTPCYGGMFHKNRNENENIFQIIKRTIQQNTYKQKDGKNELDKNGQPVLDKEQAEKLIERVYCSSTRAHTGKWHGTRMNNHKTGYCRDKTIPWHQKLRYELNEFFGKCHWLFCEKRFFEDANSDELNWFVDMSRSKRNAMGFLIGSEGKIYFPLKEADKFGYDNYFKNKEKAKELHKTYSGPEAKKRAYDFLGIGDMSPKISNEEVKTNLRDENMWKSYYTSGCTYPL